MICTKLNINISVIEIIDLHKNCLQITTLDQLKLNINDDVITDSSLDLINQERVFGLMIIQSCK